MFAVCEYIEQVVDHVHCILAAVGHEMLKTFTSTPYAMSEITIMCRVVHYTYTLTVVCNKVCWIFHTHL